MTVTDAISESSNDFITPGSAGAERPVAARLCGNAVLLGLAGHVLIYPDYGGLGATLWGFAVLAVLAWFHHGASSDAPRRMAGLYGLSAAAALCLAWRASPLLQWGNVMLFIFAIAWIHLAHTGKSFRSIPIAEFLSSVIRTAGIWATLPIFHSKVLRELSPKIPRKLLRPLVRGLAITTVLLLVFGRLLTHADPHFGALFRIALPTDVFAWMNHGLWVLLYTAIALALTSIPIPSIDEEGGRKVRAVAGAEAESLDDGPRLSGLEILMPMAALDLLFALFVYVQIGYLFGGERYVKDTVGVTFAEYARQGFFELATVAILILSMQLLFDWLLRDESKRGRKRFHNLAMVQVGLSMFMLASAAHRMALYQEAYGLTQLRFYATAGIFWIGLTMVWHGATVLRNRRERFVCGALLSAIAVFFLVQAINPDGLIARSNLERMARQYGGQSTLNDNRRSVRMSTESQVDRELLRSLSADAFPVIHALLHDEKGGIVPGDASLFTSYKMPTETFRTWSWSYWQARHVLH